MALHNNPNSTPVPSGEVLVLALLTEELKSRRFFNALAELGMDNPYFRPQLDDLILQYTGLKDDRNETYDFFCRVLDEHAQRIDIKEETVIEEAGIVYKKLIGFFNNLKK